jgi:transposase
MRGDEEDQGPVFSYIMPAQRVPADHPLRPIRKMTDEALKSLSPEFDRLYSKVGRPSIPPERLLRALLLQCFYGIRSERLLMEQLDYNLLFRWFVGLNMDDKIWDATVFSKNRDRLLEGRIALRFLEEVVAQAREAGLTSDEHFSVDGTLIEAWASMKSFVPKETADAHRRERNRRKADRRKRKGGGGGKGSGGSGSNRDVNFHGTKRSNATHESSTDPDAALYRKGPGKEAKLYYAAHALMENRNGLLVGLSVSRAVGTTERDEALRLLKAAKRRKRATVGGDKGYDAAHFVDECRDLGITPHVAMNNNGRRSAIDERSRDHVGYWVSQRVRKRIEEVFGWAKTYGGLRKSRFVGRERTELAALLVGAAYNLMRISRLVTV